MHMMSLIEGVIFLAQIEFIFHLLKLRVDLLQIRRQLCAFNLLDSFLELQLDFFDHLWILLSIRLEIEIIDILRVERFYPLGD